MLLSITTALALASRCAPAVAPETLLSIVQVESRFNPLAINVNGAPRIKVAARSAPDAIAKANALIRAGRNVDLGLAQINSKNLSWLALSVEGAFDPCRNLAAAARVLQAGYVPSEAARLGDQPALHSALSRYNTGDDRRGFANGYVAKVSRAATWIVPALRGASVGSGPPDPSPDMPVTDPPPPAASWDVFREASATAFLVQVRTPASAVGAAQ